ncbi:SgcJ/EcaC family oxidoreductase [Nocardia asiatica]|uniref:SgcJ/EcaC family oxidoreductase n=1 Tax=Nocardia asiatica TaxID=209252 RepID=UPI0002DF58F7|nr:SgcJ/EcaC family oxidoreductase [Nocardia asiatica]
MSIDQRTDADAVRDLFDRQAQAWADGDAETFAALFTPDADYVTWVGTHFKGRAAIAASHVPLFEKYLKGTRLDGEITQLRFLTPDIAIIHSKGAVLKGKQRRTRRNTKVQTTVAVRQDGRWQLAAFHNTKYHWLLETLATKFDPRQAPSKLAS